MQNLLRWGTLAACIASAAATLGAQQAAVSGPLVTPPFEVYLDALRQQAGIPGLSAAVLKDSQIVWERGFGYQNLDARIPATPDTPYLIGDISQTFATALLLQCVEERHLDLDEPLTTYDVSLPESETTMRQVLSHMAVGTVTPPFKYEPERFARLTAVVEWCAPQPYRKSVAHRLLDRLAMKDSVPGRDLRDRDVTPDGLFTPAALDRYIDVLNRMAVPYKLDKNHRPVRSDTVLTEGINAAEGLVSTVRDLARFDAALDDLILLRPETLTVAWSNVIRRDGAVLPTGLGWFVQGYQGEPVVWHFGLIPGAYSSLILKLPNRHITLIMLANSDGLTAPYQLANGDVTRSIFATVFLRLIAQ